MWKSSTGQPLCALWCRPVQDQREKRDGGWAQGNSCGAKGWVSLAGYRHSETLVMVWFWVIVPSQMTNFREYLGVIHLGVIHLLDLCIHRWPKWDTRRHKSNQLDALRENWRKPWVYHPYLGVSCKLSLTSTNFGITDWGLAMLRTENYLIIRRESSRGTELLTATTRRESSSEDMKRNFMGHEIIELEEMENLLLSYFVLVSEQSFKQLYSPVMKHGNGEGSSHYIHSEGISAMLDYQRVHPLWVWPSVVRAGLQFRIDRTAWKAHGF